MSWGGFAPSLCHVVTEERPDGSLIVRPATPEETYQAESKEIAAFDTPPPGW